MLSLHLSDLLTDGLCDCSSVIDVPVANNKSEPKPAFIKSKWEEVDENQLAQQGAFTRSVTILQTCTIVLNVNKSNRTGTSKCGHVSYCTLLAAVTTSKWDMFEQYASSGSENGDARTGNAAAHDDIDGL